MLPGLMSKFRRPVQMKDGLYCFPVTGATVLRGEHKTWLGRNWEEQRAVIHGA